MARLKKKNGRNRKNISKAGAQKCLNMYQEALKKIRNSGNFSKIFMIIKSIFP